MPETNAGPSTRAVDRERVGTALLVIGSVGVVAALLGGLVGWRTVGIIDELVADDGVLSADTVATLEGSVALAQDTVATLERSVAGIEATTRELAAAFEEGEDVLGATAALSEEEIAPSLAAAQAAMPGLIEAASVIDTALVALSALPFGPTYSPEEPFDVSLRRLEQELDGLPEDLEEQAALIREAGATLGDVRAGTGEVANDLAALHGHLGDAAALLDGYAETAANAADVVADSRAALGRQLVAARLLVVVLGLVVAAGQLVPLGAGWLLRNPDRIGPLLAPPPSPGQPALGPDDPGGA